LPRVKRSPGERKEVVKRLLAALDDGNATRRLAAVLALGKLGPDAKEAIGTLQARLNDPYHCVLTAAVLALPLIDPGQKTPGKTPQMLLAEAWTSLKSAKNVDPEELVQFYVLASTIACPDLLRDQEEPKLTATPARPTGSRPQRKNELRLIPSLSFRLFVRWLPAWARPGNHDTFQMSYPASFDV
jgi:hypothetical protein